METYAKERFYAQLLTLQVFISLAFTFDLTMHMAEGTELGFFTLWIGTIVPFTSVLLFATMPTLVTKTRSVVRDLLGVFSGTTLFGVVVSIVSSLSVPTESGVARGNEALGFTLSPILGMLVVVVFALSSGIIEHLLHRRTRYRHSTSSVILGR